jgi:DeoR family transcriptional regulator, glycerol-3-phosphate regulon repressor
MREMIAEQRHRKILDRLRMDGAVAVGALSAELGVSRETIRRDLHLLEGRGKLLKHHGGAVPPAATEPDEDLRAQANAAGKRRIGRRAAAMVPDGATVIIDSGTTARCLAEALASHRALTVITNDLGVCHRLWRRDIRVVLLGGAIQAHEEATLGADAVEMLGRYHADFAFVGAGAITADGHLTDFSREAEVLRTRMLQGARTACVIADHMKFGRVTPVRVAAFGRGHTLITDRAPEKKLRESLRRRGVRLVVAAA